MNSKIENFLLIKIFVNIKEYEKINFQRRNFHFLNLSFILIKFISKNIFQMNSYRVKLM